jgi:hypothetical protein
MRDDTMSHDEIRRNYRRLSNKGNLNSRETTELAIYEAVLFNGGKIETTRDYTPPKRRGWF